MQHFRKPALIAVVVALAAAGGVLLLMQRHEQRGQAGRAQPVPPSPARLILNMRAAVKLKDFEAANANESALARLGGAAVLELASILRKAEPADAAETELQERAAWALGEIGDEPASQTLFTALATSRSSAVRGQVLLAISRLEGPISIEKMQGVLLNKDEDESLRSSAAMLLARRKEPEAVKFLVESFADPSRAETRGWIVQALAFTSHAAIARPVLSETMRGRDDDSLRGEAVLSLVRLLKADALEEASTFLKTEPSAAVRRQAVTGLGEIKTLKPVRDALLKLLADDADQGVRAMAAASLGIPGARELLAPLERAINQETGVYVQLKIVEAIGVIGRGGEAGDEAKKLLSAIAASEQPPRVRGQARIELQKLAGEPEPPPAENDNGNF